MKCQNRAGDTGFLGAFAIGLLVVMLNCSTANAQIRDSLKTGYLPDAAEEYWPAHQNGEKKDFSSSISHIQIRGGKGFISTGIYLREFYELFDNYLWGKGPQDNNGYFLHRAIVHGDFRYNKNFRVFTELESSFVTGRNGGPRAIQDEDKLALDQYFAEYSFYSRNQSLFSFRFGKQALNYGVGSLLDIRETNVRRSWVGAKFIFEDKNTKIDVFAMDLMKANPGAFDDKIDQTQKIAGAWFTQTLPGSYFGRLDAYYLFTRHDDAVNAQGTGNERRNTVGMNLNFGRHGFIGFTEADFQFGKFDSKSILAWKIAQTFTYKFSDAFLKPGLSFQGAISSGDHNLKDSTLGTFSPLYPKAIYYGYIDNVGSANIMLVHTKVEVEPTDKFKLTAGYYSFWRESTADGIYGATGALFVSPPNDRRYIGSMYDLVALYTFSRHFSARIICTYDKRGPVLQLTPTSPHDIRYLGITTTLRL